MNADSYTSRDVYETVTILDGDTLSSAADLSGTRLIGLHVPTDFEGTQISFKASLDAQGSFDDVRDNTNTALSNNVTPASFSVIDPAQMLLTRHVKLESDAAQSGDVTITLISRPL